MSSEKFEIGEVAILCNCPPGSWGFPYNGSEVIIESSLMFRRHYPEGVYLITVPGFPNSRQPQFNGCWSVGPKHLRKKPKFRREMDRVISWDNCAWQPKNLEVIQ